MNFRNFYKEWIKQNVSEGGLYGEYTKENLTQFCETLLNQNHSGGSWSVLIKKFFELIKDYENQYNQ